jgi:hypothetical protein
MPSQNKSLIVQGLWGLAFLAISGFLTWITVETMSNGAGVSAAEIELKSHEKLDGETSKLQRELIESKMNDVIRRLDRIESKMDRIQQAQAQAQK